MVFLRRLDERVDYRGVDAPLRSISMSTSSTFHDWIPNGPVRVIRPRSARADGEPLFIPSHNPFAANRP